MSTREQDLWSRIKRLTEPQNNAEMAALMGASMAPGVGTAIDAVDLAAGIEERDPTRAGIALAATALPFISAVHLKALKKGIGSFLGRNAQEAAKPTMELAGGAPRGIAGLLRPGPKIQVYHGSGSDFDEFLWDKIGSGEGAQAYGHGLYTAESEAVARSYRDALGKSEITYGGEKLSAIPNMSQPLRDGIWRMSNPFIVKSRTLRKKVANDVELDMLGEVGHLKSQIKGLEGRVAREREWLNKTESLWGGPPTEKWSRVDFLKRRERLLQDIRLMDSYKKSIWKVEDGLQWFKNDFDPSKLGRTSGGRMYDVTLHADPESFIDWDTPIQHQPEWIQSVFPEKMRSDYHLSEGVDPEIELRRILRGRSTEELGGIGSLGPNATAREISEELRSRGIPGIRYRDAVSRSGRSGRPDTRNYVVFDPGLMEINRKYQKGGVVRA